MKHSTKVLALAGALLSLSTLASSASSLRFGLEAQYPPFESKSASGELQGFDIDLGKTICSVAKR